MTLFTLPTPSIYFSTLLPIRICALFLKHAKQKSWSLFSLVQVLLGLGPILECHSYTGVVHIQVSFCLLETDIPLPRNNQIHVAPLYPCLSSMLRLCIAWVYASAWLCLKNTVFLKSSTSFGFYNLHHHSLFTFEFLGKGVI